MKLECRAFLKKESEPLGKEYLESVQIYEGDERDVFGKIWENHLLYDLDRLDTTVTYGIRYNENEMGSDTERIFDSERKYFFIIDIGMPEEIRNQDIEWGKFEKALAQALGKKVCAVYLLIEKYQLLVVTDGGIEVNNDVKKSVYSFLGRKVINITDYDNCLHTNFDRGIQDNQKKKCQKLIDEIGRISIPKVDDVRIRNVRITLAHFIQNMSMEPNEVFIDFLAQMVHMLSSIVDQLSTPKQIDRFCRSFAELMGALYPVLLRERSKGLTAGMFFSPRRLFLFYYTFVWRMTNYLNSLQEVDKQDKHSYSVILSLSNSTTLQSIEHFGSITDKYRMVHMELPEEQICYPQWILFMLAHETAHFVGTSIREREVRLCQTEKVIITVLKNYYEASLRDFMEPDEYKEVVEQGGFWEIFQGVLKNNVEKIYSEEMLERYLSGYYDPKKDEKFSDLINIVKKRRCHTDVVSQYIPHIIYDIFRLYDEELWGELTLRDFGYWNRGRGKNTWQEKSPKSIDDFSIMSNEENARERQRRLWKKLRQIYMDLIRTNQTQRDLISLDSILYDLHYLLKECFADLVAVLTVRMESPLEYIRLIEYSILRQGGERISEDRVVVVRMALVIYTMMYKDDNPDHTSYLSWEQNALVGSTESVVVDVDNFIHSYIEGEKEEPIKKLLNRNEYGMSWIIQKNVLQEVLIYLLKCKKTVEAFQKNEMMQGNQIAEMFHLFDEESDKSIMNCMDLITAKCVDEMQGSNIKEIK